MIYRFFVFSFLIFSCASCSNTETIEIQEISLGEVKFLYKEPILNDGRIIIETNEDYGYFTVKDGCFQLSRNGESYTPVFTSKTTPAEILKSDPKTLWSIGGSAPIDTKKIRSGLSCPPPYFILPSVGKAPPSTGEMQPTPPNPKAMQK